MSRTRRALVLLAGALGVLLGPAGGPASAQDGDEIEPRFAAPIVIVNRTSFQPGDELVLTIAGFRSPSVTAFVCGNDARRGSSDCDNVGAKTAELRADGSSTVVDMVAAAPPLPCPCVVRVASPDGDEVAIVRVTVIGHPSAPVVGGDFALDEPLAVAVDARRASSGFVSGLFASLGASTSYDVTLTLRNRSADAVSGLTVDAWAGRGDRILRSFEIDVPAELPAGETIERTVTVELPAPHFGTATWRVEVAAPNAPTITAAASSANLPWLLILLLTMLVVDLLVLAFRLIRRLRRRRDEPDGPDEGLLIDLTGAEPLVTAGV